MLAARRVSLRALRRTFSRPRPWCTETGPGKLQFRSSYASLRARFSCGRVDCRTSAQVGMAFLDRLGVQRPDLRSSRLSHVLLEGIQLIQYGKGHLEPRVPPFWRARS